MVSIVVKEKLTHSANIDPTFTRILLVFGPKDREYSYEGDSKKVY